MTEQAPQRPAAAYPQESEKAIIGGLLNSPTALGDIAAAGVVPEAFYTPVYRAAYEAILNLEADAAPVDPVSVADVMQRAGHRNADPMDLFGAAQTAPVAASLSWHAGKVVEGARRRRAISIGQRLVQYAPDAAVDIADTTDGAAAALEQDIADHQSGAPETIGDLTVDALDYYSDRADTVILSGYPSLDELLGGFGGSQVTIIAARPGQGKSTIALDIARKVARYDGPAMFFSMEMSRREITARAISAESGVDLTKIMRGTTHEADNDLIGSVLPGMDTMRLLVDDSAGLTMAEIQSKCRKQHRSPDGLKLVVIDYIGLISATQQYESRQTEISAYSRAIKKLALELDVPVIVVAQLSRGADDTDRPGLRHLRESGALEQDADRVLMLARNRDDAAAPSVLSVMKNRAGQLGDVELMPQLWRCRFMDPGPEHQNYY